MKSDIEQALHVLKEGGLILYPTDTIWGIGCDATNTNAVQKIYQLKKREDTKSMLVLVDNEVRLQQYIDEIPEIAWQLISASEKPLTIIYPGAKNLAENLVAEDGSIGIRIPRDRFCNELIGKFRKPIVSTSANFSSEKSPEIYDEISEGIKNGVDHIVSWRQNEKNPGKSSSIIKLELNGVFSILRD